MLVAELEFKIIADTSFAEAERGIRYYLEKLIFQGQILGREHGRQVFRLEAEGLDHQIGGRSRLAQQGMPPRQIGRVVPALPQLAQPRQAARRHHAPYP